MATPPFMPGPAYGPPASGGTAPGTAAPGADPSLIQLIQMQMAQQGNTQGTTQVGPQVPRVQVPQPQQRPREDTDHQVQAVGVGQGGAVKRADRQNLMSAITNTINTLSNRHQQREARDDQQVFDRFAQANAGMTQAKAQMQDAQSQLQQASAALKANPQDENARAQYAAAAKQAQQAKQAIDQNTTILNDIGSDKKKLKLLQKGYGIDDKNAGTPERQAAIAAYKKANPGASDQVAGVMSNLPQTMQLSPQAQQQAMARQAGVVGRAATGGQELQSAAAAAKLAQNGQIKATDQFIKQEQVANKAGMDTTKAVDALQALGMVTVKDADGNVKRAPDGTLITRTMTAADVAGNPTLAAKFQQQQAKTDLAVAQAKATTVRARVAQMAEQRKSMEQAQATDPAFIANAGRLVTDPSSGQTITNYPMASRPAIIKWAADNGKVISKPLTPAEWQRSDLASNAVSNIDAAKAIVARRPDLFGPAGWGGNKFKTALGEKDPDAADFVADITLANLPAVGIHGVRGKWALEDLEKQDGTFYQDPAAMNAVLNDIDRSANEFKDMGGRRPQTSSPQVSGGGGVIVVSPEDMK